MRNEVIFMFFYTGIPVMMAAAAVVMDLRTARVDNGWILFCMAAGLAMRILANGIIGVFWYFTGALIPVVLLGWLFVFRMLGPGDIKLLSVIGGILGAGEIVKCILGAMFIGLPFQLHCLYLTAISASDSCIFGVISARRPEPEKGSPITKRGCYLWKIFILQYRYF